MDTDLMGLRELSGCIGARHESFSGNTGFSSVAIDSRNVGKGTLFFALEGTVSDGHRFVKEAFLAGACAAVVQSSKLSGFDLLNIAKNEKKELIVVENTLKSLQDSARVYLQKFPNLLKIGITGSSGKTTTKEIAASIIAEEKNTVMNEGNFNSETGLPLSIFKVRSHHEAGVFELGMNRRGEISELAYVLKPNIALITNIGSAHIEYFGSKLEILNEKKNIFKYLTDKDIALIPKNDQYAEELAKGLAGKVKFYGKDTFKELEKTRSLGLSGTEIIWAGETINFALGGKHNLENAIAAAAIAMEAGVSNSAIKKGLESVSALFGRGEILKGRTTVVRDCYNANPEATAGSIEFCDSVEWTGRKIYVIADMLELGELSASSHAKLGEILASSCADKVFLFGNEIAKAKEALNAGKKEYFYTNEINELSAALDSYVQTTDLVLLKGSRGCALERLTDMLTGESKCF